MGLGVGSGVEAVDVDTACVVEKVGFWAADEMAQLVMSTRSQIEGKDKVMSGSQILRYGYLGGIVGFGRQHKGVRVSTPAVISVVHSSGRGQRIQEVVDGHSLGQQSKRGMSLWGRLS